MVSNQHLMLTKQLAKAPCMIEKKRMKSRVNVVKALYLKAPDQIIIAKKKCRLAPD